MTTPLEFDRWLDAVASLVGVSIEDLPDQPYGDWYDDDDKPTAAAARALLATGQSLADKITMELGNARTEEDINRLRALARGITDPMERDSVGEMIAMTAVSLGLDIDRLYGIEGGGE